VTPYWESPMVQLFLTDARALPLEDESVHAVCTSCSCLKYGLPLPPVPTTVLDPFAGTCTTALAAQRLGRRSVMVDLSEPYLRQGIERLAALTLPLPLEASQHG